MRWTTDEIRKSFLDFFKDKRHTVVPSAPLVPKGDPTLLFTNAGTVQFRNYFLAVRTPAQKRVAACKECLRISGNYNALEAVGRDSYLHTFFEMLARDAEAFLTVDPAVLRRRAHGQEVILELHHP